MYFSVDNASESKKIYRYGSPKFHTSLCSTHQFNTKGPFLFRPQILQFNSINPSVQHQKPLRSTHPSVPHSLSSTHPSVQHQKTSVCWTEGFLVLNWGGVELRGVLNGGGCETEGGLGVVELRGFWCWKGVVLVLNWGVLYRYVWKKIIYFSEIWRNIFVNERSFLEL